MAEQEYTYEERVIFALQWLGFEDVEIGKKFSTENFENSDEQVIVKDIKYSKTDGLVIEPIAKQLATTLGAILDFHENALPLEQKIKGQKALLAKYKAEAEERKEQARLAKEREMTEEKLQEKISELHYEATGETISKIPEGYEEMNIEDVVIEEIQEQKGEDI